MIEENLFVDRDKEMAEKCKRALEKSYGFEIQLPKYMLKRANARKKLTFQRLNDVQK
jgi:hypothetical protein